MFNLFKTNPKKKLESTYAKKMKEATEAQRKGDIDLYSQLSKEADDILKDIEKLEKNQS